MLASSVLVGWALNIRFLQFLVPGAPSMVPNTAMGLLALGVALRYSLTRQRWAPFVAGGTALVGSFIGVVTLIEYATGWQPGIDLVLFPERVRETMASLPGRPSPATALSLTLLGIGIGVIPIRRLPARSVISSVLALIVALIALRVALGYFYHVEPLYRISVQTGMAIHTAVGVALLAGGLLCIWSQGIVALFRSPTSGGVLARRLAPAAALAQILVGWLILIGHRADWYDAAYATSLYALLGISIISSLILWSAYTLAKLDNEKADAHRRLAERHAALQRTEALLLARTKELEAINRELEGFTYSVSHDLRAPLRQVGGFARILMEDLGPRLAGDELQHLERITGGARRMSQLIDDLLRLSRVGRQELRGRPVPLRSIVDVVIADLREQTPGRAIEWRVGPLPTTRCDAGLVKQLFTNLLTNAVKFTRDRSPAVIEIGETVWESEPVVFVKDNGVGFDEKYADKLFGIFQRLHRTDEFEGTGVGLAVVERIVARHGGRVWARGTPGEGAQFFFTLALSAEPVDQPHAEEAAVG